jgi:hypothetical protein
MPFNIPFPVWCVLLMFYGLGAWVFITGKTWTRTGKVVTGAPARVAGATVLGLAVLFTVLALHPEKSSEVSATMIVLIVNEGFLIWMLRRRQTHSSDFLRLPLDHPPKGKRKRKEF